MKSIINYYMGNSGRMGDGEERFCYAEKGSPRGELAPARATERGLQFLRLIVITPLRLDKLGTSPQGEAFLPLAVLLLYILAVSFAKQL